MSEIPPAAPSPALDAADRAVRLMQAAEAERTSRPEFASPLNRVLARLCDLGFFLALAAAVFAIHAVLGVVFFDWQAAESVGQDDTLNTGQFLFALTGPAVVLVLWLVHEGWYAARAGQTAGKRLIGIHALDAETMEPPGEMRLALRFAVWALPAFALGAVSILVPSPLASTIFGLLALAVLLIPGRALWAADRRGFHDRWFGTVVLLPRHGLALMSRSEAIAATRESR